MGTGVGASVGASVTGTAMRKAKVEDVASPPEAGWAMISSV